MKLKTPRWWYLREGAPAPLTRALLQPIAWIWTAATARRLARTQPYDPGVPVISIGNLTVGGSGKTPVARDVLARLRMSGVAAHGLSRGYGGRLAGPVRVDPQTHSAGDVGDEPLMLAQDGPMWIARDRAAGARAAVAAGAEALVLDDAHQNPALCKSLSLVVVDGDVRDGEWPFGDGAVFPAGPMREPLANGLARADAVLLLLPGDTAPDPNLLSQLTGKPILLARLRAAAPPLAGPQLAFAGIAKPWRFERTLRDAGVSLVDFAPFPDHAAFAERDLDFLAERAGTAGLLTTEKDWVRLDPAWRSRIRPWPICLSLDDASELDRLLSAAGARRGKS
jgi:tetraacyldisaccharide 4'-kinase